MSPRRWSRPPLAAVAVILAILVGQIGAARASLCPTAAACRCCAKVKRTLELDATIAGRCCAIEAAARTGAVPEPAARQPDAPIAIAPRPVVIAARAVRIVEGAPAAAVIARSSGPPLWLTTRALRL